MTYEIIDNYKIDNYCIEVELLIHPIFRVRIVDIEGNISLSSMNIKKDKEDIIKCFLKNLIIKEIPNEKLISMLETVIDETKNKYEVGKDRW